MISPALRRVVMPPPAETYLKDILQFDAVLPDGKTIRCKDGRLVQTVALRGIDYGSKTEPERRSLFAKRHAWLMKLCAAGDTMKLPSPPEKIAIDTSATFEHSILHELHRQDPNRDV